MADRLARLYAEIHSRATQVDEAFEAAAKNGGSLDDVRGEWEGLRALLAEQDGILEDVANRTRELSSLSAFLQTHSEHEKQRLARELHDQLGGILTPAKMDLAWLIARLGDDPQFRDRMSRLSGMIDQGIDLKRRIIENLRPSLLDHLGLAAAVRWYVDETCVAAGIACRVRIGKLERLAPDLEIALFRVIQESLNNVLRHAHAKNVELVIERGAAGLRMAVCDDGEGIADVESARANSHGLAGMAQRMRAIEGTLSIQSKKGEGTRVEAFLPLAA
ncbi:MAG TPA: sensor histidine kinase [Usitatibacter sp.]|nr:sensor histidine kinase [Usitatibacter sp.]